MSDPLTNKTLLEQHPLPNFPPHLPTLFPKLCEAISLEEAKLLEKTLERRMMDQLGSLDIPEENKQVCALIAKSAGLLLAQYDSFSPEQQALVVGAVYYFLDKEDYMPDEIPFLGFEDDRKLLNHVLARLGREDLLIFDDAEAS